MLLRRAYAFVVCALIGATLVSYIPHVFAFRADASIEGSAIDVPYDEDSSLNWAGYAADGGEYTEVSGSWVVPELEPVGAMSAYAAWVGIGGIYGSDLIQAGTAAVEDEWGRIDYFAWYETLPAAAIPVPVEVEPGDAVSVVVREMFENDWRITIRNDTTGDEINLPVYYESSRSSAEWIQERPMIDGDEFTNLSGFEPVTFTNALTRKNGQTLTLEEAGARPISMRTLFGDTLAVPSLVSSDGTGFSVARTQEGMPAPPVVATMDRSTRNIWIVLSIGEYERSIRIPVVIPDWPTVDLLQRA